LPLCTCSGAKRRHGLYSFFSYLSLGPSSHFKLATRLSESRGFAITLASTLCGEPEPSKARASGEPVGFYPKNDMGRKNLTSDYGPANPSRAKHGRAVSRWNYIHRMICMSLIIFGPHLARVRRPIGYVVIPFIGTRSKLASLHAWRALESGSSKISC
jgi:hypothetical protein